MVFALREDRTSVQRWRDFEKRRSTDTLVPGIARKSRAIDETIEKVVACDYIENIATTSKLTRNSDSYDQRTFHHGSESSLSCDFPPNPLMYCSASDC